MVNTKKKMMLIKIFVSIARVNKNFYIIFKLKDGGILICCDNCSKAFHIKCLKYKSTPKGKWCCPVCESPRDICTFCEKNVFEFSEIEKK